MHFHTSSEEAVNGEKFPMVAHFVHASDAGELAVLAVFFEEGEANPQLAKILAAAPTSEADIRMVRGVRIDPSGMLPRDLSVYRYQGSLTTPPFTEGVNWHIASEPITVSSAQLTTMKSIMSDNARPLQPRNGRLLVAPE